MLYLHTHTHTHTHTHIYIYTYIIIHVCVCVCVCMCDKTRTETCYVFHSMSAPCRKSLEPWAYLGSPPSQLVHSGSCSIQMQSVQFMPWLLSISVHEIGLSYVNTKLRFVYRRRSNILLIKWPIDYDDRLLCIAHFIETRIGLNSARRIEVNSDHNYSVNNVLLQSGEHVFLPYHYRQSVSTQLD